MSDYLRTDFEDFQNLLHSDELKEEPVDLDTFIYDRYYLGNLKIKEISETQRLIIEQLSQVYKQPTLIKLYGEEEGNKRWDSTVNELVAMCGKGGGKDFSTRIGFAYAIYKLHCLNDPIEYYNKSHGTYVDLLNIAVNAEQAQNVFFSPLKNMLSMSPYFQEQGFEPRKSSLEFYSAPIRVHSGNSEAEAWEGLDLMLVVLDEIAAFKTDQAFKSSSVGAQRLSASSIYRMSKASVMSRFPDIGKVILLSFPRYCVTPDTPVLTSELDWVKAGDLQIGDKLVSVTEDTKNQRYKEAEVTFAERAIKPCFKITTTTGEVISSFDHPWLVYKSPCVKGWIETQALKPGDVLPFFGEPWEQDSSRDGGYIAGQFDNEIMRFLGTYKPMRLSKDSKAVWDGVFMREGSVRKSTVVSVEYIGEQEVASLTTSTGTFLANGFYAHNTGDFITQRYDEAAGEEGVLRIKAPTWVMNPYITREMLEPEFKRNPIDSEQRFGCNPPAMVDAYFRDPEQVRKCFKGIWEVTNVGQEDEKLILKENPNLIPIDDDGTLKPWFKADTDYLRFVHVDLGLKRDRAAIAMCHSPGTRKIEVEYGVFENLPVVKMDLIHYWEAQPGKEIDFSKIREFIKLLARKFPIGMVTFDRWQSVDMIQILNKRGIRCETHSVKKNDYDTLSTAIADDRFTGYFHKVLVEDELLKLQVLDNGKIDHPDGFHDDLAQTLAAATWHAVEYADVDGEIDISVIGDEDEWELLEYAEAMDEERSQRDGRVRERSQTTYDESEMDFDFQVI